jgi:cytochrome b involved in lipid metabolism
MNPSAFPTSLFDTIGGLPVHPLAVHVAVVFLPLSALALGILIFVPKWRKTYFPLTLIGLSVSTVFTFTAKESGEQLEERVGSPSIHEDLGEILFPASVGLLAVGLAFYFLSKSNKPKWMIQSVAGVALAAIVSVSTLTYFVGHTGAEATWADRIAPQDIVPTPETTMSETPTPTPTAEPTKTSSAPKPTKTTTPKPKPVVEGYTKTDVAKHATESDCWSVVNGVVYDLTSYVSSHPGGPSAISNICGKDATQVFSRQHGGDPSPTNILESFKLGAFNDSLGSAPVASSFED